MRRTPGPWALRGTQIRADDGKGAHVATYQISIADGKLIAAAPELLDLLDAACRSLDAAESGASHHSTAGHIRTRLAELGLWRLMPDEHGRDDYKTDPMDLNPDVQR